MGFTTTLSLGPTQGLSVKRSMDQGQVSQEERRRLAIQLAMEEVVIGGN